MSSTYDAFSDDYDRFVNWSGRLQFEMPFIEAQLNAAKILPGGAVLDAACGTGMHVIALSQRGYNAVGTDLSEGMIRKARYNAQQAAVSARFEPVGFGKLAKTLGLSAFSAVLCLGNSLPHLLSIEEIAQTLADFYASLLPGGLLLIQNRNFDAVLANKERWMEPQSHQENEQERLFLRFYDFLPDGLIDFNIMTLRREKADPWRQMITSTRLYPVQQKELVEALGKSGYTKITCWGGMDGSAYDPPSSPNLVVTALKG